MNKATLYDHCIICSNGNVCSKPSPTYNGLCVDHSHDHKNKANYWRSCDLPTSYYFAVFKPTFEKCVDALLDGMKINTAHEKLKISQIIYSMLSEHKHYTEMNLRFNTVTKNKLFELINEVQGMSRFTQEEKLTYAQNMKTYYHDIFPYDNHEFNL